MKPCTHTMHQAGECHERLICPHWSGQGCCCCCCWWSLEGGRLGCTGHSSVCLASSLATVLIVSLALLSLFQVHSQSCFVIFILGPLSFLLCYLYSQSNASLAFFIFILNPLSPLLYSLPPFTLASLTTTPVHDQTLTLDLSSPHFLLTLPSPLPPHTPLSPSPLTPPSPLNL